MRAALRTFDIYQDAEYNTATARARTAKQFEQFMQKDNLELFPCLRWIPSRSANPRAEHTAFYNRIWRKDDPFWNNNQPGTEWNCKCDIEETDEQPTDNNDIPTPDVPRGLEGNPANTGEIFTDNAPYIRHMQRDRNANQRKSLERACQAAERDYFQRTAKENPISKQTIHLPIGDSMQEVHFPEWGIKETAQSMFGDKLFWLKNEVLNNPDMLKKAKYIRQAAVDMRHNTGKTLRRKRTFNKFHYIKFSIWKGETLYAQVAEQKDGTFMLYTITKRLPLYE